MIKTKAKKIGENTTFFRVLGHSPYVSIAKDYKHYNIGKGWAASIVKEALRNQHYPELSKSYIT
jgi:hypothetical protein